MIVEAPISVGELVDKVSILLLKLHLINDKEKAAQAGKEFKLLHGIYQEVTNQQIDELFDDLYKVNKELWDIEDSIRIKEKQKLFDDEFIQLARSVYITNDKRAEIKRKINQVAGSDIMEVKSYEQY